MQEYYYINYIYNKYSLYMLVTNKTHKEQHNKKDKIQEYIKHEEQHNKINKLQENKRILHNINIKEKQQLLNQNQQYQQQKKNLSALQQKLQSSNRNIKIDKEDIQNNTTPQNI